jgi:sulfonate transport system permease protein
MSAAGPLLRGLAPPLLILGAWQAAGTAALADPRLLPPPAAVAEAAWDQLARHGLLRHLAVSLGRDLAGFSLGAAAGVAFGGLAGLSRLADRLLRPGFDALKSVAVFAWIPLIALWFGIGETSKVVFIALATFWPVAVNTWEGVARVPAPLREVAAALTLTRAQRLRHLVWPSALPAVLTGVQLGLIHSWLATVGSEYFLSKGSGIGGILVEGRERFDMPLVILGVAVLGLVGFALNRLAQLAGTRLAPWRQA